ncbi:MAG: SIR2 family protein [Bradyrhizobium sp.]|uniref:SIR2 family protein n=1 Tax=Bradyrhizobium sp. TaxID=376 RepID=UPI0029AA3D91|nr:SIR2 family protein [Bradyrhizobium sp.]MDX3966819.1 SIR2 family protein [Bradyrhizobium sp.]
MAEHDPLRFATELSAKLATRSRHVCVFLGAGAARACGLPDIAQLQDRVLGRLSEDERGALNNQLAGRNLEEALSRLRRIAALITGDQTVDGLNAAQAKELDAIVCQAIVKELDIEAADLAPVCRLAAWAARAGYRLPIELFTVNYDLLLETALERLRVPYFDGFVGTLMARFHTELVEGIPGLDTESVPAFFVRLWKLHGSVNWAWQDERQIVRLGKPVAEGAAAAIYPSDTKYEESRRVPFVVLQDRLRRALHQPETLVIVAGYSFGDAHLNELLFDAAVRRERSEFVAFCYSEIPDALADRANTTPNLQVAGSREAILGGVRGNWKPPADAPAELWENDQLALRDFGKLAAYLARSAAREPEVDSVLRELVDGAMARRNASAGGDGNG